MIGQTLGHYRIVEKIGAGHMGEVYKATDTRLDRTVPIQVLPALVPDDLNLKQRFEREAKTLAELVAESAYRIALNKQPQCHRKTSR